MRKFAVAAIAVVATAEYDKAAEDTVAVAAEAEADPAAAAEAGIVAVAIVVAEATWSLGSGEPGCDSSALMTSEKTSWCLVLLRGTSDGCSWNFLGYPPRWRKCFPGS